MSNGDGSLLYNDDPRLRSFWHPVARSGEVGERPVQVELLGERYVLARLGERLVAFVDRCPHRFAPLSFGSVDGDELVCGYHGWRYGTDGACRLIPALGAGATVPSRARLDPVAAVAERYGVVFIAPDEPLAGLLEIPEDADSVFGRVELEPTRARASAGLMADNFLDFAHFPFVHAATFGADEAAELSPFEVVRQGAGFEMSYVHPFANREDPGVSAGVRPLIQTRAMTYCYQAPFALRLRLEFVDSGGVNTIAFFIQPEARERVRLYTTLWRNDLGDDPARIAGVRDYEQAVLDEDLALQSRYGTLALPLETTLEIHTRADRSTLELRRILAGLLGS